MKQTKYLRRSSELHVPVSIFLMDGRIHKIADIAWHFEVSPRTIQRTLKILREKHNIEIHYRGGRGEISGIQLDKRHVHFNVNRDRWDKDHRRLMKGHPLS